jgi:hypothetical protein
VSRHEKKKGDMGENMEEMSQRSQVMSKTSYIEWLSKLCGGGDMQAQNTDNTMQKRCVKKKDKIVSKWKRRKMRIAGCRYPPTTEYCSRTEITKGRGPFPLRLANSGGVDGHNVA